MLLMIPFHFQKGNKTAGCEDAPPIAKEMYSIVCDGLGGSGSTKHNIVDSETNAVVSRTSAYLGSRIVSSCVENYYTGNVKFIENLLFPNNNSFAPIDIFVRDLKRKISEELETNVKNLGVEPPTSKALKLFPTTLASSIYLERNRMLRILVIWAGDSRVYKLSPSRGLQLLSLDDADAADESMNSASAMNNCISARNQFHLNYAVYDINEPCILFSCSDGCFDYIQSPLHLEWLLLNTILDCMPEGNNDLGISLANTIKDSMYSSIGDDTTMAGICYCINTVSEIKQLYQNRMRTFGQSAVNMNECIKNLKDIQGKRDSAAKTCRIYEGKIQDSIQTEICKSLHMKQSSGLYSFIKSLNCYGRYISTETKIDEIAQKNCDEALCKLKTEINKEKENCMMLMTYDYMKWQRIQDEQNNKSFFYKRQAIRNLYENEKPLSNKMYANPLGSVQVLETFLKMYSRPEFIKYLEKNHTDNSEKTDDIINEQINAIHNIINLIGLCDDMFVDIWSQSYFSTRNFEGEYSQIKNDMSVKINMEAALKEPNRCEYLSNVTLQSIAEYNKRINELTTVEKKYELEAKQQKENLPKAFYEKNRQEILENLFSQPLDILLKLFENTSVNEEFLRKVKNAKDELTKTEAEIVSAQRKVDLIWNSYRFNYELYKFAKMKGVV